MHSSNQPGIVESVGLYALLTAVTALSLDIILPAYAAIGATFGTVAADLQHGILLFIGGMLIGELLAGALADRRGRRFALAISVLVFSAGTVICALAPSYSYLLAGRVLQGIGAAGQKICTRAIIRDRYSGSAMARIMSYVLALFVALPFVAPALGAAFTHWYGWRSIFIFLGLYSLAVFAWYWTRHPETMSVARGSQVYRPTFFYSVRIFFQHHRSVWLTVTAGFLFGIHLSFISLSPLVLADAYQIVEEFPLYFGGVVCAFGLALILNARYVERIGMVPMVSWGLVMMSVAQFLFIAGLVGRADVKLPIFLVYGFFMLFSLGLVFGNLTALVLQPLGKMAGVASAVSSALSTAIALIISTGAGLFYGGNLLNFALSCGVATFLAVIFFVWSDRNS